ncbi:FecR domain-containing protein [Mucilaginibacter sp. Bleaf8]|uniref:FecR family protein n=1 Tax=Mucilaginibacter sp. Bleaf8 TaxID=2834430 RepID=UPI001BCACDB1|nr:FecR domain-containing protein [Mucilaginibacter sp. Bleaf8]MBS7567083.1 FecR domain-containing protein [Mucilaginibacter sp. Bleaf8]
MKEQEIYLLITRYLANQTSTEENERIADWIAESAQHEQIFEDIKLLWQASAPKPNADVSGAFNKLRSKIGQETNKPVISHTTSRIKWYAIAASVVAILTFSGLLFYHFGSSPTSTQFKEVVTTAGQKKKIRLEDGTAVFLAPQSTLRFPGHFSSQRNVELRGQAYFEVSKNPHRPFVVHTASLDVQVLGTHFNVSSYQNQNATKVSLLEGKVKVTISDNGLDEYLLSPGQELAVNHINHQVYRYALDSLAVKGWMSNTLIFKNEKLVEAAHKIEQMYGVRIVFADQATAETNLYARFGNEPLQNVLETIAASGNITYHIEGNKIYFTLKH